MPPWHANQVPTMPITYLPSHGKTVYSFGGGGDDVRVSSLADTTSYSVTLGAGDDSALLGAGNDYVVGGKGSDTIAAGAGNDLIYGGEVNADILLKAGKSESDLLVGDYRPDVPGGPESGTLAMGNDTVHGATGSASLFSTIYGDFNGTMLYSNGGNDLIYGGSGTNKIWGDAYRIGTNSAGGDDTIYGGAGATNLLVGDCDYLIGKGGNDVIYGGSGGGGNVMYGDARELNFAVCGNDVLVAGGGTENTMIGDALVIRGLTQCGNDQLFAGTGNDHMWGDFGTADQAIGGADTFHFEGGIFGHDDINDYNGSQGDKIVFTGDPAQIVKSESNGSTVFTDTATGGVLTVVGVVGLTLDVDYSWAGAV
jgi:Ca2+-binding RTX toxin-like protein